MEHPEAGLILRFLRHSLKLCPFKAVEFFRRPTQANRGLEWGTLAWENHPSGAEAHFSQVFTARLKPCPFKAVEFFRRPTQANRGLEWGTLKPDSYCGFYGIA
jgi:hypothetical protein